MFLKECKNIEKEKKVIRNIADDLGNISDSDCKKLQYATFMC